MYYFGCWEEPGHYLVDERMRSVPWELCPVGYEIDTGFCPKGPEIEGKALLHFVNGWTILAFWDRSVDTRGKCNSAFLWEGKHEFDEMLAESKKKFPGVFAWFKFEVVPYV